MVFRCMKSRQCRIASDRLPFRDVSSEANIVDVIELAQQLAQLYFLILPKVTCAPGLGSGLANYSPLPAFVWPVS